MSKLISGECKLDDLSLVIEAAQALGWTCEQQAHVSYYEGAGALCDVVVRPVGELSKYDADVGAKYTIGFQKDASGKISMLHDNAMDGGAVFSAESGLQDDTTKRIVGKLKQAIAQAQVSRILVKQKASWRVEQREDGAKIYVVRR